MDRPLLRSMLFVPGDQPRMVAKAPVLDADAIIFDLEDGVAARDKLRARAALETVLRAGLAARATVWVRPNGLDTGLIEDDLAACLWPGLTGVVVPKVRGAAEMRLTETIVEALARDRAMGPLWLAVLIETPQAAVAPAEIGRACSRLAALMFGADDLAAEMGLARTDSNDEVAVPRAQVALVAHALGCEAVDIVCTRVRDEDGFRRECAEGRRLGYTGKQVIHPSQIAPANAAFSPRADEIAWATRIIEAYQAASRGAFVVDGRMVDAPIVAQARRVLERARRGGTVVPL